MIPTATAGDLDDFADSPARRKVRFGRFMLPDMSEHPCQVTRIDADGASLAASRPVALGTLVVAYLDEVGRIEGTVVETGEAGFALAFNLSPGRRDRLAKRLDWLDSADAGSIDQRRHQRHEPRDTRSQLTLPDGREYACEVIDISLSGAAVKTDIVPSLGTYVMLGKMRGRVVRFHETGIAIEFVRPLDPATLAQHAR